MAPVNLALQVTWSLVDGSGSAGQVQSHAAATATLADVRTAATALIPLIQANTGCAVIGYSVNATTIETAPANGADDSRVERRGLFTLRTAAGKLSQISIPGIVDAAVLASGRIDDDNAAIEAMLTAFLATPWTDSNGSDLVGLHEAYEVFRTTKKRQKPSQRRPDSDDTEGN